MFAEMKSLREEAEKRINEKMEGIDTARTDALDAIAAEVEVSFFSFFSRRLHVHILC